MQQRRVLKKGVEEGFEKGRREEKFEMARNLKAMGMTSEQIMNITHLSLAEIESLSYEGMHKEYIFTKEALHLRQPLFFVFSLSRP